MPFAFVRHFSSRGVPMFANLSSTEHWDVEFVIVKFCLFYDNMVSKRYISLELAEL